MNFWKSVAGTVRIRITSASMERLLTDINDTGIVLDHTAWIDDLTIETSLMRNQYKQLRAIALRSGNTIQIIHRSGVYWRLRALRKRPVLLISILLFFAFVMILPSRVFFVQVTGNDKVTTETILTQAETAGVRFGTSKKLLRSEQIKNTLLSAIPELQWAGVNTRGCVAIISVRERSYGPEIEENCGVRSIVAKCDGVIQEMTVTKGNALCKVGDLVKKGQILVSGYTDCGIQIKATAAEAEIYAQTAHAIHAITPMIRQLRYEEVEKTQKYSLIIGKKLIKLYKDSGISDTSCVKMYEKKYLVLPGGFQLPLALAVETQISYKTIPERLPDALAEEWTLAQARQSQTQTMIAGQILSERTETESNIDVLFLTGQYNCYEMIGQIYNEEIINGNEQRD